MPTQEEIIQALGNMPVIELIALTKELETKWGVTATPQVIVPGPQPTPETAPPAEEKTEFDVVLLASGDKRIEVIKVVRAATGLGLKEAKDLVEKELPKAIKEALPRAAAEELKSQLEAAGGKVELR